jgi:hypothetical protein
MDTNPNDNAFCAENVSDGLSKMEYFVNHAPNEIPQWFKHKPTPAIEKPPSWQTLSIEEDREIARQWFADAIFDLPEHLKWFQDKWADYYEKYNEWQNQNNIERYFQWRTFYADRMIAELNKQP